MDTDVPTFEIKWSQTPGRRSAHWHTAPLGQDVTLLPGEARRISAPGRDEVVELDAVATLDGALASAGTHPALVRQMRRFGEYRLALTVEADGQLRRCSQGPTTSRSS